MNTKQYAPAQKSRIYYIDNIRIFLTILVVLVHLAVTYGAPGNWYYIESEMDIFSGLPLSMFNAVNQAFFMGMFFMIAAYFTHRSLDRKGLASFLKDRLLRLGIPLLFFYFILSPLTKYLLARFQNGADISFWTFLTERGNFGWGPMWFVEALLYFTLLYAGYRFFFHKKQQERESLEIPRPIFIILFALFIGLATFFVRINLPVGWQFKPLNFQICHFLQYIALFTIGIIAFRNRWLESISFRQGKRWFLFAHILILIGFPILFITGGGTSGNIEPFMGGWHWQSLVYALWEQVVGFSLILGLIGLFKGKLNSQGKFAKAMSASAYTTYITHTPILVAITLLFQNIDIHPLLKFIILAPLVVGICFLLANLIRQLSYVRKVV